MTPTALVTGGQQGIGRGIAEALHDAGWQVALVAEQPGDAPAVQEALSAMPGTGPTAMTSCRSPRSLHCLTRWGRSRR